MRTIINIIKCIAGGIMYMAVALALTTIIWCIMSATLVLVLTGLGIGQDTASGVSLFLLPLTGFVIYRFTIQEFWSRVQKLYA